MPDRKVSTSRLRAGVGQSDITPAPGTPQGGWGAQTHERGLEADMPMLATALALEQDGLRLIVLDVDAIGFSAEWTAKIVEAVAAMTGLERSFIRFSCSHTHAGANTFRLDNISSGREMAVSYLDALPAKIAGAAWRALQSMVPVRADALTSSSRINRKRRVRAADGEVIVGVNEDVAADHSLGIVRIDREDGSCLATVVHYACHPTTCGWENVRFSPDYPGPMRATVERETGGVCVFLQGAAGDLGPRRGFTGDLSVYRKLGHELGLAAAAAAESIDTRPQAAEYVRTVPSGANIAEYRYQPVSQSEQKLAMISRNVALPTREFEAAEEIAARLSVLREEVKRLRDAHEMDAMRRVQAQATQLGWRLENARLYGNVTSTEWPMQAIRLGDIAFLSMAGEPFSSIGERIREKSPFAFTFVSGYSNGGFGYIPDAASYREGGYEVAATPFAPEAADVVVHEGLKMLNELFEAEERGTL